MKITKYQFQSIPFEIDEDVEVIPTPGHVNEATSVVVKNTQMGTVAITGQWCRVKQCFIRM